MTPVASTGREEEEAEEERVSMCIKDGRVYVTVGKSLKSFFATPTISLSLPFLFFLPFLFIYAASLTCRSSCRTYPRPFHTHTLSYRVCSHSTAVVAILCICVYACVIVCLPYPLSFQPSSS